MTHGIERNGWPDAPDDVENAFASLEDAERRLQALLGEGGTELTPAALPRRTIRRIDAAFRKLAAEAAARGNLGWQAAVERCHARFRAAVTEEAQHRARALHRAVPASATDTAAARTAVRDAARADRLTADRLNALVREARATTAGGDSAGATPSGDTADEQATEARLDAAMADTFRRLADSFRQTG